MSFIDGLQENDEKAVPESVDVTARSHDVELVGTVDVHASHSLKHALTTRHLSMIAPGGALGTGLIIGTGPGLARAGPGAILITYALVGVVVYLVLGALGEVATWLPLSSGFTGYGARYLKSTSQHPAFYQTDVLSDLSLLCVWRSVPRHVSPL